MAYIATTATNKVLQMKARIRAVQGGTSASKTISILLSLIAHAQMAGAKKVQGRKPGTWPKDPVVISVVSESLPHLKKGAMRDFLDILSKQSPKGAYDESRWSKTDFTYTFESRSKMEFFGVEESDKVRGPRRDVLFMNEANNIPFDTFDQLEVRTKNYIFLDWNPTNEFWFYTEVLGVRSDVEHITLTYKDNEALAPAIIASIEQRKSRKSWWRVYGEGQLGEVEGKIYRDWEIIDEIPHEARLERFGLDFGYSNDPAALIAVYYYNGGYILDEILYDTGMHNKQIADVIQNQEQKVVTVADCAEPKSIDEIRSYGVTIIPAEKGKDSRNYGIGIIQDQRISMTRRSYNLIKEYRNYLWAVDRNGQPYKPPRAEDGNDHALDAVRYAMTSCVFLDSEIPTSFTPSWVASRWKR